MHNILIRKPIFFSYGNIFIFKYFVFDILLILHSVNSIAISNRFVYSAKTKLFKSDIENFHGANPDGAAVSENIFFARKLSNTQLIRLTFTSHSKIFFLYANERKKSLSGKIERKKFQY